jgi:Sec-independent protein translocase protein TatA
MLMILRLMGDVAKGIKSFKKGMSDNPEQTSSLSSTSEKTSNEESSTTIAICQKPMLIINLYTIF